MINKITARNVLEVFSCSSCGRKGEKEGGERENGKRDEKRE